MPRRTVAFASGSSFHLYNRGVNKQPIFLESRNYPFFVQLLDKYLNHDGAIIAAYCLMPNHYHLLVRVDYGSLSTRMQRLGMAYTNAVNKANHRTGPLFQGRFKAKAIDQDEYLLQLSRYLHLNPVEAGLVDEPAGWPYSSYAAYLGLQSDILVHPELVLSQFSTSGESGPNRKAAAAAYKKFIEGIADETTPPIGHLTFD